MQRIAVPVLLTGFGMAFPWDTIRTASLANGEIVSGPSRWTETNPTALRPSILRES